MRPRTADEERCEDAAFRYGDRQCRGAGGTYPIICAQGTLRPGVTPGSAA